jgi:hypothetical protein
MTTSGESAISSTWVCRKVTKLRNL